MAAAAVEKDASRMENEEALFKSLTHQIRRDIIRVVGPSDKGLTFSEIQKEVGNIESSNLSYHLKNLQPLIPVDEGKYRLSEIGEAAYRLLQKVDQDARTARYKRKFLYAYIITTICWALANILIPFFLLAPWGAWKTGSVIVLLNLISAVNTIIIGILRGRY